VNRSVLLLVITFLEEVAGMLVARGVYFYTHERMDFSDLRNLALALTFGLAYVAGALLSGPFCRRLPEKHALGATIVAQGLTYLALFLWPTWWLVFAGVAAAAVLNGMKWPIIESYVSAGLTPVQTSRAIGRFNMTWATAVPATMVLTGPLVAFTGKGIFLVSCVLTLANLFLTRPLRTRPLHLPHDHPTRPGAGHLRRYAGLLASGRWTMIASYAMLKVLDPLVPGIFESLGIGTLWAAPLWSTPGWVRLAVFAAMRRFTGWHGRSGLLLASLILLPVGFFLALLGPGLVQAATGLEGPACLPAALTALLCGAVLIGLTAGVAYYAALWYAMVVRNASVDAGGVHESLIGLAFAAGPAAGLAGAALAGMSMGFAPGYLLAAGPLAVLCAAGAFRSLLKAARAGPVS